MGDREVDRGAHARGASLVVVEVNQQVLEGHRALPLRSQCGGAAPIYLAPTSLCRMVLGLPAACLLKLHQAYFDQGTQGYPSPTRPITLAILQNPHVPLAREALDRRNIPIQVMLPVVVDWFSHEGNRCLSRCTPNVLSSSTEQGSTLRLLSTCPGSLPILRTSRISARSSRPTALRSFRRSGMPALTPCSPIRHSISANDTAPTVEMTLRIRNT